MNTHLQHTIMRRVYYVYALRVLTMPGLAQGFVMFCALLALTHFVSLGNVLNNLMYVEVGRLHQFFYNAAVTTEEWTFFLLGILIFSALSFRFKIRSHVETPHFAEV